MRRVNLGFVILGFDGKPLQIEVDKDMTIGEILLIHLGSFMSEDPKEMIVARVLGEKVYSNLTEEVKFEEAEFDLIKKSVKNARLSAVAMGVVHKELEECQKEDA